MRLAANSSSFASGIGGCPSSSGQRRSPFKQAEDLSAKIDFGASFAFGCFAAVRTCFTATSIGFAFARRRLSAASVASTATA